MAAEIHVSDRDLLRRTREGDAEAFGHFYRQRRGMVLAYLRLRVPNAELAADLMCETFTQALVAVHDHQRELPVIPIAWLLTITRNELIDSVRRGRVADTTRRRLAMEPLELSDRDIDAIEDAAADAAAVAELETVLPADQFQALSARVLDGRDYEDIASELECSPSVVRKRVSRAVAALRSSREENR
ncbi:MAG TPA: RNA polymerase sigma factor [Solirubrobacteraceae bacterium]|jgi:RNA polymerase sigma-70 factor (ECF subfamily)|nr:RNA polymerase sigma factor [Solirubrobacteraceae bacterium]